MTTTLNMTVGVSIVGTYTDDTLSTNETQRVLRQYVTTFTDGTGDNQADRYYATRVTSDGSGNSLELNDGSLIDVRGNAVSFEKIKTIYVRNWSATASLLVGGDFATAVLSGARTVQPSGWMCCTAPLTGYVVITNGDTLTISAASGTQYDVVLIGLD